MRDIGRDIGLALRLFRKSPGFTVPAVLCLALGIGVNASIFSLLDYVYLRPLAAANAERLVVLSRAGDPLFSVERISRACRAQPVARGASGFRAGGIRLELRGQCGADRRRAGFGKLRLRAGCASAAGPMVQPGRRAGGGDQLRRLAKTVSRDPDVLGKTIRSESHTYTVVGVAPQEFGGIYSLCELIFGYPSATGRVQQRGADASDGVWQPEERCHDTAGVGGTECDCEKDSRGRPGVGEGRGNGIGARTGSGRSQPVSRHQAAPAVIC